MSAPRCNEKTFHKIELHQLPLLLMQHLLRSFHLVSIFMEAYGNFHSPFRGYWIFNFQYEISDDEFGIFPRVLSQNFSEIL